MKIKLFGILVGVMIFIYAPTFATVFIVDQKHPAANDVGKGTEKQPFKTISAVADRVKAGDKVLIHSGIYRESVELKTSGKEGNPIIFEAADRDEVIMQGSVPVIGWITDNENNAIYIYNGWDKYFGRALSPENCKEADARIKPRNQLFSDGEYIEEVFTSDSLKENSFFIDKENKRIHLWLFKGEDPNKKKIEVSNREFLFSTGGNSYITIRGIQFKHGANPYGDHLHKDALVRIVGGQNCIFEGCRVEWSAGEGLRLEGKKHILRRSIFNHCGESGFNVYYSVDFMVEECENAYNNNHPNKEFSFAWGGAGSKHCLNYRLVFDRHSAHHNNGAGIWFDISNNECVVKNSLCCFNVLAGVFYEISYALHAHDNVLMCNGFSTYEGAYGYNGGISLSESSGCVIERNLLIGNLEGLNFRDNNRVTAEICDGTEKDREDATKWTYATWNHDDVIQKNVMAFNENGQLRGWLNKNGRMLPQAFQKVGWSEMMNSEPKEDIAKEYLSHDDLGQPVGLSLEKLKMKIDSNIYWDDSNPNILHWGNLIYQSLEKANNDLKFEGNGKVINPLFADWKNLDLRVPAESPLLKMGCYPKGEIPGVKLGVIGK